MPRHQRAVGRHPTQGQRNTGVCGHRKVGGDAWNHLKGNAGLVKNTALVPSPAEHKGVTPLQAHPHPAGPDMLHHMAVYLVLRNRMGGGALAHVDAFCLLRRVIQYGLVHESVVQNDVGPLETAETADGDQPRIPRSSAYQVDTDPIQQIRRPVPRWIVTLCTHGYAGPSPARTPARILSAPAASISWARSTPNSCLLYTSP